MTDDGRHPYAASERKVKLSWKTRRIKSNHPGEGDERGSFYAILPKGQIRQLGWETPRMLVTRIEGDELILRPAPQTPPSSGPVERLARAPLDQILCGDVLEQLRRIPTSSVHLAITSPPYNVGINYQQYRDDLAYGEYRRWLSDVWKEVFRILVRGGRFALETAPTSIANFVPIHIDLTNDARSLGFTFRAEIVWYKQNMTAPRTAWGSFRSPGHPHLIPSWEYVNVLHKEDWKLSGAREDVDILSEEFVEWSDAMWAISPDTRAPGDHPAAFPAELVRRLMRFYSFRGQTVLDPFGGTGTVAAEAKRTGRHFIHIDHSASYCAVATDRVSAIAFGEDGRGREIGEVDAPPARPSRRTRRLKP
jgi:DNA modification methylase